MIKNKNFFSSITKATLFSKKLISPLFIFILFFTFSLQKIQGENRPNMGIGNLKYLQKAYPDIRFERSWDKNVQDWKITMTIPSDLSEKKEERKVELYWCNGSLLPESELKNSNMYWSILYPYEEELKDPAELSEDEKSKIREFSSSDNRKNGAGTPMFFFDAVYSSSTRASLEKHLTRITFLGHNATVHNRVVEPLKKVEKKINAIAKKDKEVSSFLTTIKSNDSYFWRIINGTNRKSFHSLGIAMDILPKKLNGKAIFWSWTKEADPENWMLTPLNRRWIPPQKVIDAFESEGFIWGGKWIIFDNMHFEYHPELLEYSKQFY